MRSRFFEAILQKYFIKLYTRAYGGDTTEKIQKILDSAAYKKDIILREAADLTKDQIRNSALTFDNHFTNQHSALQSQESELKSKHNELMEKQQSIEAKERGLTANFKELDSKAQVLKLKQENLLNFQKNYNTALEQKSLSQQTDLINSMKSVFIKNHALDVSRVTKQKHDQLKHSAQKLAQHALEVVYDRYQPRFIWPKIPFSVNCQNQTLLEKYFSEGSQISETLLRGTDSRIEQILNEEKSTSTIKISGGLGVDKEILRLTLEECFSNKIQNLDKIRLILSKHTQSVKLQTLNMGKEAAKILKLSKIHPEILKLIGSLNFRTSHRQNQYFHSLEVAILAGMIAEELGLNPELSKRAGLLHDIGKVLDYKIEGSHAVISGDYAEKYGESSEVVDTVLAHHDDKIVETPAAYILKASDAMSGARPGARVDTEDGYNRRLDGISGVIDSFKGNGITESAIMHAGREVHVYVDNRKTPYSMLERLAKDIAEKLESEIEYPGQIRVTVIRRMEVSESIR